MYIEHMSTQEMTLLQNIQATIGSMFETINFIKDNAVTKEEFYAEINGIKNEIKGMKEEIKEIKRTMVSKNYLEERLEIFKHEIFEIIRMEDRRVGVML